MVLRKKLKQNEIIVMLYDKMKEFYYRYLISDKRLIEKKFKQRLGREVNLENPKAFNDKLQWLKLNWYDPLAIICADKYRAREFVADKIGEEYLNKLYGVYESVDEIAIDELPNSFVLKGTHGSGFNIICEDKGKMNWDTEFKKMRRWLRNNYYWRNREWVYKDMKPRIICERYLSGINCGPPNDYKIFCFNGEPKIIEVDLDRFGVHRRNIYDTDWNFIDVEINCPNDKNEIVEKPKKLDKMLELSKILAKGFPHVRVDFYLVEDKILFGELTFFHASGMGTFKPSDFEFKMGSWLELPKPNK